MLVINKKKDIIVPFDKIGDKDWDVNTKIIIESIADNWGDVLKKPINDNEINNLEKKLGTTLPDGLKLFYKTFGIADIGEQLQELKDIKWINSIWMNKPEMGPNFTENDKTLLPFLISFSDYLGNGNMFCFHSITKEIYYFKHDCNPYFVKMFTMVDDYLKGCLLFAQADLFGNIEQKKVEEWAEEIATVILGEKNIKNWRY